jgi:hypothetical protein
MNAMMLRVMILLTALCWGRPVLAQTQVDWDPQHTWVFVAGLLEWEHPEIWSSFPAAKKNRRDQQLAQYFRDAGVPAEHIVALYDSQATKSRIQQKFVELLDKTGEEDGLVFYFCGHGFRNQKTGRTSFANYDAGRREDSAWDVRSIFNTIDEHFSGNRAMLLADCCHSGAMYDEARKRRQSQIAYAVLTSSYAHNLSTGNWTFSDSVIAGLRGEGAVDLNGDKFVDLQELARYTELELAFCEGQKSMFYAPEKFGPRMKIAAVRQAAKPRVGQRIEVLYKDKWYKATSIDADGDKLRVRYVNYDSSWDEWVGPDRIRPYQPSQFADGDKIDVRWSTDGKWYPATIRQGWYGLHFIRYDGYDASWDEWVGPGSIRLRQQ